MKRTAMAAAAVAAWIATSAAAQSARVEAVQYPAWLERGGYSVPLVPGTDLRASDGVRTGANARKAHSGSPRRRSRSTSGATSRSR